MADTSSLLKKAATMFFKGLGKLLSDAASKPIERDGKLGIEFVMHTDRGTADEPEYFDVVINAWGIQGKDKYYIDKLDFYESGTDNLVKLKQQFKPCVVDDTEKAISELVNHWSDIGDVDGNTLGQAMTAAEWASRDKDTDSEDEEVAEEFEGETAEESSDETSKVEENGIASSKVLKAELSRIAGSSEIAVSKIYATYNIVKASEDLLYVIDNLGDSNLVTDDPVTVSIIEDKEDYDVEECEECKVSVCDTFKLAFDAILSIQLACNLKAVATIDDSRYEWVNASNVMLDALNRLRIKLQHLGCDILSSTIDTVQPIDIASTSDAFDKASQALYLLASNLEDNTTFDDIISAIDNAAKWAANC